jgi:hypothetical protein
MHTQININYAEPERRAKGRCEEDVEGFWDKILARICSLSGLELLDLPFLRFVYLSPSAPAPARWHAIGQYLVECRKIDGKIDSSRNMHR